MKVEGYATGYGSASRPGAVENVEALGTAAGAELGAHLGKQLVIDVAPDVGVLGHFLPCDGLALEEVGNGLAFYFLRHYVEVYWLYAVRQQFRVDVSDVHHLVVGARPSWHLYALGRVALQSVVCHKRKKRGQLHVVTVDIEAIVPKSDGTVEER